MSRHQRITDKLNAALQPEMLELRDISHTHAGHAGLNDSPAIETHFTLKITSPRLAGLPRVAQHRLINDLLAEEFNNGLHALSIKVL